MSEKIAPTTHALQPGVQYDFYYSAQHRKNMSSLASSLGLSGPNVAEYATEAWDWLQHPSTFKGNPYTVAYAVGEPYKMQPGMQHLGRGTSADALTTPQVEERASAAAMVTQAEASLQTARANAKRLGLQ